MKKTLLLMTLFVLAVDVAMSTGSISRDQRVLKKCTRSRIHDTMRRSHFRLMSTERLTNAVMRALEARDPMLLMPYTDHDTMFVYNSELPMGGTYKGHRGLLMLWERVRATLNPISVTCNITAIDNARGTALMKCMRTCTFKNTGHEVASWALIGLKFALSHIEVMNVVDLDYNKMLDAYRTNSEKMLHRLQRTVLEHGRLSPETLALLADNCTITLSCVGPRTLFTTTGKKALVDAFTAKTDAVHKFGQWLSNITREYFIMSADEHRVISVAFAGRVRKETNRFEQHPEGVYQHGAGNLHMLTMYSVVTFDDQGKLISSHTMINKAFTVWDEFHLKEKHGITLPSV